MSHSTGKEERETVSSKDTVQAILTPPGLPILWDENKYKLKINFTDPLGLDWHQGCFLGLYTFM